MILPIFINDPKTHRANQIKGTSGHALKAGIPSELHRFLDQAKSEHF